MNIIESYLIGKPKNVQLHEDEGSYYLTIDYPYENNSGKYNLHIEKVLLDLDIKTIESEYDYTHQYCNLISKNGNTYKINPDNNRSYFDLTLLEEKVHKLTVEEIEKKLGYKVSIISK